MKWMAVAAIAFLMAACNGHYEVGDYYRDGDVEGIVMEADEQGNPLMLLSLEEASNLDADSAAVWASKLGDGRWRLPDKKEMESLRINRSLLNMTLERKGLPLFLMPSTFYWTSQPCSETHMYACGPYGVQCYFRTNKSVHYRARAVKMTVNSDTNAL